MTSYEDSIKIRLSVLRLRLSSIWAQLKSYLRWSYRKSRDRKWRDWKDVSHVTGSDVSHQNRKYVLRMRNRKWRNIRPSGTFWPEVTGRGPVRKWPWPEVCSAHARLFPAFFLSSSTMATGCDLRSNKAIKSSL
jgi:hypothetical protein